MKLHLKRKSIALLSILAMLLSAMYFAPVASAADNNESESNNTCATADVTYNDYNNYGTIGSSTDIDWWRFVPTQSGVINIWMGNIPSGCNYYLYFADSSGALLASSDNSSNSNEDMRVRVYASHIYYLKVGCTSGYSSASQYLMRLKMYDLKKGRIFTSTSSGNNYQPAATNSLPYLWQMGYDSQQYIHNTAKTAYNSIPTSDIFVARGHGTAGAMAFYHQYGDSSGIYGYHSSLSSSSSSVSMAATSYGAFSDVSLIIYCGCKTGATSESYQNLVNNTYSKEARCVIGWTVNTFVEPGNEWIEYFFEACASGKNVSLAVDYATEKIIDNYPFNSEYQSAMASTYIAGNSNGIILG